MDDKTVRELIKECETLLATGLATPAHRLPAHDVVTWVRQHPNSAFHELIDWTPQADAPTTDDYQRGQMITLLDRLMHAQ